MARPVIYFDWDGTLGDSMDLCLGEIRLALKRMGLHEVEEEKIRACNGPTHEESVGVLGLDPAIGPEFLRQRRIAEQELIPQLLTVYPGTEQMLASLSQIADLAIVSNGQADYIRTSVEIMGYARYFTRLQASIPGLGKTEVLRKMLEEMQPERACLVGDRRTDIEAGYANALPTLAVTYGYGEAQEFVHATARAGSVAAAQHMLETWVALGHFGENET